MLSRTLWAQVNSLISLLQGNEFQIQPEIVLETIFCSETRSWAVHHDINARRQWVRPQYNYQAGGREARLTQLYYLYKRTQKGWTFQKRELLLRDQDQQWWFDNWIWFLISLGEERLLINSRSKCTSIQGKRQWPPNECSWGG